MESDDTALLLGSGLVYMGSPLTPIYHRPKTGKQSNHNNKDDAKNRKKPNKEQERR